jgi:hypothetical protein
VPPTTTAGRPSSADQSGFDAASTLPDGAGDASAGIVAFGDEHDAAVRTDADVRPPPHPATTALTAAVRHAATARR